MLPEPSSAHADSKPLADYGAYLEATGREGTAR